jgi:hypothetical protein
MTNPQQNANETPKAPASANPQQGQNNPNSPAPTNPQQGQNSPKPAEQKPNEQQK